MKKYLSVIPECYVETNMAKTFLNAMVSHEKGCGAVTRTMQVAPLLKDGFALGLIDDDKMKSKYSEEFVPMTSPLYISDSKSTYVQLLHHDGTSHYLFITHKAMEDLMIQSAKTYGIDMGKYNLSNDLNDLKAYTKKLTSDKDPMITKFFKDMANIQDSPLFKLKKVLNYMVSHPYDIDINYITTIFK